VGVVTVVGVLTGQQLERLTPALAGKAVGQVATVYGLVVGFDCAGGDASAIVFRTDSGSPEFKVAVDVPVEQWQFKPGTREGVAVPTAVDIELTFTLKKE